MAYTNGENPRYTCDNWDEGVEVKLRERGKHRLPERKVITTGIAEIDLTKRQMDLLVAYARQGRDVRLTYGSSSAKESICRFIPCLDKDGNLISTAQTMQPFRGRLYEGKRVSITTRRGGDDVTKEDVVRRIREIQRARREQVSPDTLVTCPECGTEFRVGRKCDSAANTAHGVGMC
ncbi:MAG: hypothetical protein K6F50_09475 [Kiritimatiellae bacterium]|nr:hypothetical protein [Kiritimatiellia bacterium]